MPEIRPFKGLRYNPAKIKKLAAVFAPPYDVISKKEQSAFYRKDPRNVIRLILNKKEEGDSARENKYTRAGRFLRKWTASGVLVEEERPSIYVYVQDYKENGRQQSRVGFIAAMKIDEKAILKHENTLAAPKKDRMALLKEVKTNLSPIFGLFEDKKGEVQKILKQAIVGARLIAPLHGPAIDVTLDGVRHRVFVENRAELLAKLTRQMRSRPMFIADGHHRFEVTCQFKDWMRSQFPNVKGANWDYVMTYFSDCAHNPFKIFPTHRLVVLPKGVKKPLEVLGRRGTLERVGGLLAVLKRLSENRRETRDKNYSFGVYTKKDGFFIFTLDQAYASRIGRNPVDQLDVAVLHQFIIEPCFKIKAIEKSSAIDFTRDPQEACRKVQAGGFDVALFLRPTSLEEMLLVSKKGLKMPQKSTYFYPKLLSGLVFHKLTLTASSPRKRGSGLIPAKGMRE